MTAPSDGGYPRIATDVPTPARMYDYCLGGKDNFEVDRLAVLGSTTQFPEGVDNARENRRFLYRAVRFLAHDAGITQFLDLGSGLPTENNVHQVAQQFQPTAQVVYVDNDPIVLSHGRALLAKDHSTTVIAADMTQPREILDHRDTRRRLDFAQPMAVLFLSVGHSIVDDGALAAMLAAFRAAVRPGSYFAYTQMTSLDQALADQANTLAREQNWAWKVRLQSTVTALLAGLEPVEPGLVHVRDWRPDPDQPPLPQVDEPLQPFVGASDKMEYRGGEFGGVLRVP